MKALISHPNTIILPYLPNDCVCIPADIWFLPNFGIVMLRHQNAEKTCSAKKMSIHVAARQFYML